MRQMSQKDYPSRTYGELLEILPVMNAKRIARFEQRVDRSAGSSACHPFRRASHRQGYGFVQGSVDYRAYSFLAHRVAWAIAHGREPGKRVVRHSCDNPPCCNPAHLLLGTHKDNHADAVERARLPHPDDPCLSLGKRGTMANAAGFTAADRTEAYRLRYAERWSFARIASAIGCHRATLYRWL